MILLFALCAVASGIADERLPAPPTSVRASDGAYADRIRLTWQGSPDAAFYAVCRSTSPDETTDDVYTNVSAFTTVFLDRAVVAGTTYYYCVRSGDTNGVGAVGAVDAGFARPAAQESLLGVESVHPDRGVLIIVGKKKDAHGLLNGETPFVRAYNDKKPVTLEAPKFALSNAFHHWELNGEFAGASTKLRVIVTNHTTAIAVYLTNHAAHTVKCQIRGAKTYLVAKDFDPPLSQLLSNGVNSFRIRDMTSLKVVDGPFAIVPRAHGMVWLYNGARSRKAVLKVFAEENVMVYVTWAWLPDALRIEGVPLPNAHP